MSLLAYTTSSCLVYSDGAVSEEGKVEPSAQVKGVWDSVVSWMKMAVDYIALDNTVEAVPSSLPHGRVNEALVEKGRDQFVL